MVITELDVGGAEKAFVRIAIGLKNLGWQVSVISLRNAGPLATLLEAENVVSALRVAALSWDVRDLSFASTASAKARCLIDFSVSGQSR